MKLLTRLLALAVITGCTKEEKVRPCTVHVDCLISEACVNEVCQSAECFTSDECERGAVCSDDYTCVEGCDTDIDCSAGERCNEGTCATFECRDPQLDCDYGEVCDGGVCALDAGGACNRCDPDYDDYCFPLYEQGSCRPDGSCADGEGCRVADYDNSFVCSSDDECAAGYECLQINFTDGSSIGPHCTRNACFAGAIYPPCDPTVSNTCPRGFQCFDVGSGLGVCFGDCEWLTENGHL